MKKNCTICNKEFFKPTRQSSKSFMKRKFCSYQCYWNKTLKNRAKKICLICNKEFIVSYSRRDTAKYCSRECQTESKKGHIPWNKNIPCKEGVRIKISKAKTGKQLSEAHKNKIGLANKGKKLTLQTRKKLQIKLLGNKNGRGNKGKIMSSGQKEKLRKINLGKKSSEETKRKIRKALKGRQLTPTHLHNILTFRSPNKSELLLNRILKTTFPHEWKFVGNGKVSIEGKNPDFININGRKLIIDLFGKHWHEESEVEPRKELFAKYGYKTLILWDYELKNEVVIINKVKNFY